MIAVGTYVGSITDAAVGADAIVNASNPEVLLGSGVSAAIRRACGGDTYQEYLSNALEEEFGGALEADDCLATGPGTSTAFRWVLHVPAVDFSHPDPETGGITGPSRVKTCFRAALDRALELAHAAGEGLVVAAPILGAGVGGLGVTTAVEAMVTALREVAGDLAPADRGRIQRVVFAVLRPEDARVLERTAEKHGLQLG
jgi:O-acetyl-ADP-ribose deacetylase (regulator of RNase III)